MILRVRAPLLLVVAAAASGCAGPLTLTSGNSQPTSALRVGLVEWQIITSSSRLAAGTDRLTVTNAGTTGHDLYVRGPGVHAHTRLLAPGSGAVLTISTRAGTTVTLTCEVPGHEEAGMHATVRVSR